MLNIPLCHRLVHVLSFWQRRCQDLGKSAICRWKEVNNVNKSYFGVVDNNLTAHFRNSRNRQPLFSLLYQFLVDVSKTILHFR